MSKKYPSFAVIGAGNCGQAMAAHLKSLDYKVKLYNRSAEKINAINKKDGITLKGILKGRWMPDRVTTSIYDTIKDADIIMIVTPASAHKEIAAMCAQHLREDQIVILNPGRTFGALEFLNTIKKNGFKNNITIAEAQTTIYTARLASICEVEVLALKNSVWISSIPSDNISKVYNILKDIYPQFSPVENTLITSLNNIGAILHPTPTLFNVGWIEKPNQFFKYYYDAISPTVAKFLEKLDNERIALAKALDTPAISILDWFDQTYGVKENNLYDAIQNNPKYRTIDAPKTVHHRYLYEDIPTGLVPVSSLGDMLGVSTPNTRILIEQASSILETNFWECGRTVENLGLKGLHKDQIKTLVNQGSL